MLSRVLQAAFCALAFTVCCAQPALAQDEDFMSTNLVANGDFERDADGDGYPDDWPRVANARLTRRRAAVLRP